MRKAEQKQILDVLGSLREAQTAELYGQMKTLGIVKSFKDLRLDIGENKQ